jgi:hypothetical protein
MRRMSRSFLIAGALLFVSGEASAFCRSSTCRTTATKECPTDENGCPAEGEKLWWPTSCISYATNKLGTQDLDPVDTRAVIKKTFQAWSEVPCPNGKIASMTFQEREPVSCKKSQYNKTAPNVNVVLFQDNDWKYRGIDGTLAKTSVTYNDQTGEIYDADIEINTANNTVTISDDPKEIEYDLQAILTHEVGHFIGIAHSDKPDAVMYPTYNPGSTTQRKLTPDDVEAVCSIYPPGSDVACETEPRNGFSGSCDDPVDDAICSVTTIGTAGADGSAFGIFGLVIATSLLTAVRVSRRTLREFGGRRS